MLSQASHQRFCHLLDPHHDELRVYARRVCRTQSDGDDLFHEAVTRALTKIDSLKSDASFRFWFYRVLISVHRNHTKRSFWSRFVPLVDRDPVDPSNATTDLAGHQRMRSALAQLSNVQREAIVLHDLQEMSVEEVAEVQEVSNSAVKSRLSRGRNHLRVTYRKRFDIQDDRNETPLLQTPKETI